MKKLFSFLLVLSVLFSGVLNAQSTTPRFNINTPLNGSNTGSVLSYGYKYLTDQTGADSVSVLPTYYKVVYRVTMVDSICFKQPTVTSSYAGDNITIIASGASGTKVKFSGSKWITAGTATLSTGGRAVIDLVFDGSNWVEANRTVQ